MQITVNEKQYNIEFTFEAAESEAIQEVFDFFTGAYLYRTSNIAKDENDMTIEEKNKQLISQADGTITEMSKIPALTIDFLFMGLLEHHGKNGDETQDILTRDDARALYKSFCKQNPDDEKAQHFGMFNALKEQMASDGFFKRIGLEQMMNQTAQIAEEQAKKSPVVMKDHMKKKSSH